MPTFNLAPGSGGIIRGRLGSSPSQVAHAFSVPDVPTANRGPDGTANTMLVTSIGIRAGGLSHSNGQARAKIFRSGGNLLSYSTLEGLPNAGSTNPPASETSFSFPGSGASNAILSGGTTFLFGLLAVGTAPTVFARRANTSYDILTQFSGSASSNFSGTLATEPTFANHAIVGTVTYIYAPAAPDAPTLSSASTSSITITIPAYPSSRDNGGSSVNGYRIQYKTNSDSTWSDLIDISSPTTSVTASGLDAGTTYNFRSAAKNAATDTIGGLSAYSPALTASTSAAAPTWTDNTLAAFSANIPYSDAVAANNANQYSVSAGTLPTGITLNSDGTVTGTPTVAQQAYDFTLRATNTTNSLFVSQTFTGTVGGSDQPIKVYVGGSYPGNVNGWINGTVRVFNGDDWVTPIIKVYNGVSWVTPSA
jgi:hypothetical protein